MELRRVATYQQLVKVYGDNIVKNFNVQLYDLKYKKLLEIFQTADWKAAIFVFKLISLPIFEQPFQNSFKIFWAFMILFNSYKHALLGKLKKS